MYAEYFNWQCQQEAQYFEELVRSIRRLHFPLLQLHISRVL